MPLVKMGPAKANMAASHAIVSIVTSTTAAIAIKGVRGAEATAFKGTLKSPSQISSLRRRGIARQKTTAGTMKPKTGKTHWLSLALSERCHPGQREQHHP